MVLRRPCITGFDRQGTGSFQPPLIRCAHVLNEVPAPDPLRRQGCIEPLPRGPERVLCGF